MTIQKQLQDAEFISRVTQTAADAGVNIQVGDDFTDYAEIVGYARPEQVLGDPFDCTKQYIPKGSGFWIIGRDRHGELVHTQAMKMVDLRGAKLGDYLHKNFRSFPPPWQDLDMNGSKCRPGPSARRISGSVVYHGEFFLKPGAEGHRGTGLAGILARLAMAVAWTRYSPDYVFGFMSRGLSFNGFAERNGYMHCEPNTLTWVTKDCARKMEAFMVHNTREDIDFLMSIPVDDMVA